MKKDQIAKQDDPQALALLPKGLEGAFSAEEWGAMSPEEQVGALAFFKEEAAHTTEGVDLTFSRWKFPTSGGTRFIMDVADDDPPEEKELKVIVVAKFPARVNYPPDAPVAKGTLPLCSARNATTPDVSPSPVSGATTCAACKFAQFGSDVRNGKPTRGQACSLRLNTFFLRGDEDMPEWISLPISAKRTFEDFVKTLVRRKIALISHEVVFGLAKETSSDGVEYQGLTCKIGNTVPYQQQRFARELANRYTAIMARFNAVDDQGATTNGAAGTVEIIGRDGVRIDPVVSADEKAGF